MRQRTLCRLHSATLLLLISVSAICASSCPSNNQIKNHPSNPENVIKKESCSISCTYNSSHIMLYYHRIGLINKKRLPIKKTVAFAKDEAGAYVFNKNTYCNNFFVLEIWRSCWNIGMGGTFSSGVRKSYKLIADMETVFIFFALMFVQISRFQAMTEGAKRLIIA